MDRIAKEIGKLTEQEKDTVKSIFLRLIRGDIYGLDIKKLKGYGDVFRVRKGKLRILYQMDNGEVIILKVGYRNETTYRL